MYKANAEQATQGYHADTEDFEELFGWEYKSQIIVIFACEC